MSVRAAPRGGLAWSAIVLEVFLGIGALCGGAALMLGPRGEVLPLPVSALAGSPFTTYLVPGGVLFFVIGLGPLVAAVVSWQRYRRAPFLAMAVGAALLTWMAVEIAVVGYSNAPPLQAIYLAVAAAIALLGIRWQRASSEAGCHDGAPPPVRPERRWLSFALRWASVAAVGAALILVAAFVELSQELFDPTEGASRLLSTDAAVLHAIAHLRRPWLNGVAMDLTALGSPVVVALFTVALGALLLAKADRRGAAVLIASSCASALLTSATKALFERPRPEVVPRLVEVVGLSYPSGHSLASAAVYLTAAFVLARHVSPLPERVAGVAFTAGIVLLIGASRVYLGVHYPSDVFGGILLGTSWALLMATVLRRLDRRRPFGLKSSPPPAP